ncbi:MAG: ubiquinone/menaquinone biosynthesis methyltransferase [Pelotomaculum sp. PtaB.Bin013]|nr:MAG: ubiquinone/menaquinone biosynthesis methyltransferase [Pelotomaculum sp. PtaB.Bin013]
MNLKETTMFNEKLENVFYNYYNRIDLFSNENKELKSLLNKFLKERFVERILFTVMVETNIDSLSNKSILILGLSHDLASFFLKLGAKPENITVADISSQALEEAQKSISKQLNFSKLDFDRLAFDDNTFDIMVCFNYLSNIPPDNMINNLVNELYRILKPGGLTFISFTNEIASRDDLQLSGVMRTFRPEEALSFCSKFNLINLLQFFPNNFSLFSLNNNEHIFPKRIGIIEDIIIEKNDRYAESLLLLTK